MSEHLEGIYKSYSRHVGKRVALKAIHKAIARLIRGESGQPMMPNAAVEFLLEKSAQFARSAAGNRGHLTPHPSTWFNQSRYLDDPREWQELTPEEYERTKLNSMANIGVSTWKPL